MAKIVEVAKKLKITARNAKIKAKNGQNERPKKGEKTK
jgi:hypothetical protein